MTWTLRRTVLRLHTPMHIGCGRVGNLLRTRRYVPGRVLWGALTQRLTRDGARPGEPADDSDAYMNTGRKVHKDLVLTYFFPAVQASDGRYQVQWPWEAGFSGRFLGTYASTALAYPARAAEEGSLHETEFLSPRTTDTGEPVFLMGYVADHGGFDALEKSLGRVMLGGERCYGWGKVSVEQFDLLPLEGGPAPRARLFDRSIFMEFPNGGRPFITVDASETEPVRLPAHAEAAGLTAMGVVEPMVGREWQSTKAVNCYAGQHVAFSGICFAPGSQVAKATVFDVGDFGIWRKR